MKEAGQRVRGEVLEANPDLDPDDILDVAIGSF